MSATVEKHLTINASRIASLDEALTWIVQTVDANFPAGPHSIHLDVYWVYDDTEQGTQYYQGSINGPAS